MQNLLTAVIEITAATFILLMIADFTAGLVAAWHNAGIKAQSQVELEPPVQQDIAPQTQTTLDPWLQPREETTIALPTEPPQTNRIKPILLLLPAAPEVAEQPENVIDYTQLSIRQLKRLASGRVKNYSNLTKNQLIAALAVA
jgi:hypothetical protein